MKNYKEFNFFKENKSKRNKENIIHISIFIIVVLYIGSTYINNYILYNKYKIFQTINKSNESNIINNLKSTVSYNQIKEIYYQNNIVKVDEIYSDENYIYIKGSSNNLNLISQYSKNLEKTKLFKNIFIDNIKTAQPTNINQFEIKCTLKEEQL
jgi:Fimbrial assembly protein (PilN)